MVSVHGYNSEKKDRSFFDIYFIALVFGSLAALIILGGGIIIMHILNFIVERWVWVIVAVFISLFVWKFIINKKTKYQEYIPYDYQN